MYIMRKAGIEYFLKTFYLFILERGSEGEREGEKHQSVDASCVPPTGDLSCNPGMFPDWESNWQLLCSQARTQSTEPPARAEMSIFKRVLIS